MVNRKYFSEEKWRLLNGNLKKIDAILRTFVKKYNMFFDNSCYHDWPYRNISWKTNSKRIKGLLWKTISISYKQNSDIHPKYGIGITVVTNYGLKELFLFIPILSKKWHRFSRLKWGNEIDVFQAPINKENLQKALEKAKELLDNFDESLLQEVKYD